MALRFAEPDTIDDTGVIEFVRNDCVLVGEQRFKKPSIGIERTWVKDRVFGSEESGQRPLQLLVNVLRPANKTDARHAETVSVECVLGGCNQRRVIGQTEIVVGTHVENMFPI